MTSTETFDFEISQKKNEGFQGIIHNKKQLDRKDELIGHISVTSLRTSCNSFRKDVAQSLSMCSKDFSILGKELIVLLKNREEFVARENSIMERRLEAVSKQKKEMQDLLLDLKGSIRVFCRIRPLLDKEIAEGVKKVVKVLSNEGILVNGNGTDRLFQLHKVFDENSEQSHIYAEISPLIVSCLDGYHSCIFAYGQTGSGKTYTMEGTQEIHGVNYLALEELFRVRDQRRHSDIYRISISFAEIYNEAIYDLLSDASQRNSSSLDIRQGTDGVYIEGAISLITENVEQVVDAMMKGSKNRSVFSTKANIQSSRSHSILITKIEGKNIHTGRKSHGKLVLIDLAGSERLSKTEATGDRLKEAQHINKSLSSLGDVMASILAKDKHIPFRNSKLTHLLQDSLGRNNKALMLVHLCPSDRSAGETICSLKFATRVSNICLGKAKKKTDSEEFQRLRENLQEKSKQVESLTLSLNEEAKKSEKVIEQLQKQLKNQTEIQTQELNKTKKILDSENEELKRLKENYKEQQKQMELMKNSLIQESLLRKRYENTIEELKKQLKQQNEIQNQEFHNNRRSYMGESELCSKRRIVEETEINSIKSILKKPKITLENHIRSLRVQHEDTENIDESNQLQKTKQVTFYDTAAPKTPLRFSSSQNPILVPINPPSLGRATRVRRTTLGSSAFSVPPSRVLVQSSVRKPKWNSAFSSLSK